MVRCFVDTDITHVEGTVDPLRDMGIIETELLLADLQVIEGTLEKSRRTARSGDKEAIARNSILERCIEVVKRGEPIRSIVFDTEDAKLVRSMGMMTSKPTLYVANIDEAQVGNEGPLVERVRQHAKETGGQVVVVCAKIEAELSELTVADRMEMLESLGMKEPALNAVVRAAYELLGLQSYFTAGEKEVRAWTIHRGFTAPQAAGVIHTDFERGFIRAEIFTLADLEKHGSEKSVREAGKLRAEGKSYVMQDGDITHFLFNV